MKKNLTKLLALMMALALVFSLAACGDKTGDESSTDPSNTPAANDSLNNEDTVPPAENSDPSATNADPSVTDDSQKPGDTKPGDTKPNDNDNTQKPGDTKPETPVAKAPEGVNEIVKAYNAGIVAMKSASMKRTLDAGRVYREKEIPIVGKIDLNLGNEQGVKDAFSNNGKATQISDKKLYNVNASDVSSATCKESGNNYVFTINLKTKKLDVNSAKHGDGGYSYFIDKAEATTVVASMLKAFSLPGSATIKGGSVTLSKGVIVATVSKSTGKISKVNFAFAESVVANASYFGVGIDEATITGHGTVDYSA